MEHHDQTFTLKSGSLHLIPAYTFHKCRCQDRFNVYFIHFMAHLPNKRELTSLLNCDWSARAAPGAEEAFRKIETLLPGRHLPLNDPFVEAYRRFALEMEGADQGCAIAALFEAYTLLRQLLVPFIRSAQWNEMALSLREHRLSDLEGYLHEHFNEPLDLKGLAKLAGLHPTYLTGLYRKIAGEGLMEHLNRIRLDQSRQLLLTTNRSIKEIGFSVGIPNANYFTRLFQRRFKLSPPAVSCPPALKRGHS